MVALCASLIEGCEGCVVEDFEQCLFRGREGKGSLAFIPEVVGKIAEEVAPDRGPEMLLRLLNLGKGRTSAPSLERGEKTRLEIHLDRESSWFDEGKGAWALQGELVRHGQGASAAVAGLSFRSIADSGIGEAWRISSMELLGSDRDLSLDDSDSRRLVFSVSSGFSSLPFRCLVSPPAGIDPRLSGFRQGG